MSNKVKAIPEGYHSVTPYLIVNNAAKAIEFYKKAFGATERSRCADPNGKIMHAEIQVGNSMLMLADEFPEMNVLSPTTIGGTAITLHHYVENVDAVANQAVAAGATILRPVKDQFYGDRSGTITDPFGHQWYISTHIEDVSEEEVHKRFEAMMQKGEKVC